MIKRIKGYVSRRIREFVRAEIRKGMEEMLPLIPQMMEFHDSPVQDRQSFYVLKKTPDENQKAFLSLRSRLISAGVSVRDVTLDLDDFALWRKKFARLVESYRQWGDVFIEKCLEHYLAYKYLHPTPGDVYIDVAGAGSLWADVLGDTGIKAYSLDLSYPAGISGTRIGADAGDTKLAPGFADSLSAQCAFECFMGDADIRFIKEAGRILKPQCRYSIAPLYISDVYYVSTSPLCNQEDVLIDVGAKKVWRDDGYKVPFSRHYSPESFAQRIFGAIPKDMCGTVLYVSNLKDLMTLYPTQRVYCAFVFYCEKGVE